MSIVTYSRLDFRNTYLPSAANIEMKFFEKSEVFENSPANFRKNAKFAGEFSKTLLFSRNFMLIIGVEGMLEKCGPKFQMKSYNHI